LTGIVAACQLAPARGPSEKPPAEKWLIDRAITVSPAAAPTPAFKYRLFPLSSMRKDGNAVPIYTRLIHERFGSENSKYPEEANKWNKLPLDQVPLDKAEKMIQEHSHLFRQLALGARRKTAEWNYTLDQGSVVDIRVSDAQEMRPFSIMLTLKARVEIAKHDYSAACQTFETAYSFSRQMANGPFMINGLIGVACAWITTDAMSDLVSQPDAPNLYWALTAMPRPLIDLRDELEFEQIVPELQFPELADLDRTRTAEQWDAVLTKIRREVRRISATEKNARPHAPGTGPEDPASKSPDLETAKKYLTERIGLQRSAIDIMPPSQVLVLWIAHLTRELYDEQMKIAYLPYPESRAAFRGYSLPKRDQSVPEAAWFAVEIMPALEKVLLAQLRVDRWIALLTAIEALRMHAATNGGELPASLDQVKVVPVPLDPATGKPFEYSLDGRTVTIASRLPGEQLHLSGIRYKLTFRK
jgi:hypothetical protein